MNDHTHTHTDSHPAHLDPVEARGATKNRALTTMLYVSLALAVIAMLAMWLWGVSIT